MAHPAQQLSTNVRFTRHLGRLAEAVAPTLTEGVAFRLWLRPRRTAGQWGPEGRRFELDADGPLAAWEWNVDGAAGTALLVHGWSGNATQMGSFVEPLTRAGFHVVAIDLPAHGATAGSTATLPLMARAIAAVGRRLRPRVVIAHSLGATATTYALTLGWQVERVVLLAPPVRLPPYLEHFAAQLGLSQRMQSRLLRRVEQVVGLPVTEFDLSLHAPRLGHVEVLVVHDKDDAVVPLASSLELTQRWPGARLVTTDGLSHDRIRRAPSVVAEVTSFATAP